MNQQQFDEIVDLAYKMYGNDYEGGLTSRASLDAALAAYTCNMDDDATLTEDEIDSVVLPYLGGEIDNEGNPIDASEEAN